MARHHLVRKLKLYLKKLKKFFFQLTIQILDLIEKVKKNLKKKEF